MSTAPHSLVSFFKLAEGAINPAVYVIDEDIKLYLCQYRPLRDTTSHSNFNTVLGFAMFHCDIIEIRDITES